MTTETHFGSGALNGSDLISEHVFEGFEDVFRHRFIECLATAFKRALNAFQSSSANRDGLYEGGSSIRAVNLR